MILIGLDPLAGRIAAALAAGTAAAGPALPATLLQPASDDVVGDLRRCIAAAIEAARARGAAFEPRLGCLLTASAPEAVAGLETLRICCAMLQTMAAGNQSVALVVLVPPPSADDAAKGASFGLFRALEGLVGELPFLDVVFVNQLGYPVGERDEAGVGNELATLLVRELLDPDLRQRFASLGQTAVGWRARVAGRKACYSTLGSYRLEYRPEDALAHVSARLQREILEQGLLLPALVDDDEHAAIGARVDSLVRQHLKAIEERIPAAAIIDPGALEGAADSERLGRLLRTLAVDVEGAVDTLAPELRGLVDLIDGWSRRALLDFLPASQAYLAGADAFIEALFGRRHVRDDGVAGIAWLWQELCRQPLDPSVDTAVRKVLYVLGQESAREAKLPDEVTLEWLARTAAALARAAGPGDSPEGAPARLLAGLAGRLDRWLAESDTQMAAGAEISDRIGELYLGEVVALMGRVAANVAACDDRDRALDALPGRYGLLRRWLTRRSRYRAELATLAQQRADLGAEYETLQRVLGQTRALLAVLLNELIMPQLLRRGIGARVRRDAEQASAEFDTFVQALKQGVDRCCTQAASAADAQTTTVGSRLLDGERLEALYRKTITRAGIVLPQAVDQMLAFIPRSGGAAVTRAHSYRDCLALKGHYLRGADSLLDRLRDYAGQHAAWLSDLDALDVIECQGKDAAARFLVDVAARSRRFLELSPGMLPLVQADGRPRVIFAVRAATTVQGRLAASYGQAFFPEFGFVDWDDPRVLEVNSLIVGFPAFLVHALHEGRRLALVESGEGGNGGEGGDLWPL